MAELNIKNVPDEVLQKAKQIAKAEQRPLSQVIRDLLKAWVKQNEAQPNK